MVRQPHLRLTLLLAIALLAFGCSEANRRESMACSCVSAGFTMARPASLMLLTEFSGNRTNRAFVRKPPRGRRP